MVYKFCDKYLIIFDFIAVIYHDSTNKFIS